MKKRKGGRPKNLIPCPYCKQRLGARDFRSHVPHCPKRRAA